MGVGKAQACALRRSLGGTNITEEMRNVGNLRSPVLPKVMFPWNMQIKENPTAIGPYCQKADSALPGTWALWVPKAVGHVDAAILWTIFTWQAQPFLSGQNLGLLNPKGMWSLWPCCRHDPVVDPALQVTKAWWTPKPCVSCGSFSHVTLTSYQHVVASALDVIYCLGLCGCYGLVPFPAWYMSSSAISITWMLWATKCCRSMYGQQCGSYHTWHPKFFHSCELCSFWTAVGQVDLMVICQDVVTWDSALSVTWRLRAPQFSGSGGPRCHVITYGRAGGSAF